MHQLNKPWLPWKYSLLRFYNIFQLCFLVIPLTYNDSFLLWACPVLTQITSQGISLRRSKWQGIFYTKEIDYDLKFNNYFVHYRPMKKGSIFLFMFLSRKSFLWSSVQISVKGVLKMRRKWESSYRPYNLMKQILSRRTHVPICSRQPQFISVLLMEFLMQPPFTPKHVPIWMITFMVI